MNRAPRWRRVAALTCLLALGGCSAGQVRATYSGIGGGLTLAFEPVAILVGVPFCAVADVVLMPLRVLDVSEPMGFPLTRAAVDYFFGDDDDDPAPDGVYQGRDAG